MQAVLESCMLLLAEVANLTTSGAASEDSGLTQVAPRVYDLFPEKPAPFGVGWAQTATNAPEGVASRALNRDGGAVSGKRKRHTLRR